MTGIQEVTASGSQYTSPESKTEAEGLLADIEHTPPPLTSAGAGPSSAMKAPSPTNSMENIQEEQPVVDLDKNPSCAAIASNDTSELARLLAVEESSLNLAGSDGLTPIFKAIELGNTDAVRILLKSGANIDAEVTVNGQPVTPLIYAVARKNIDAIKVLIEIGGSEKVNRVGSMGINAVHAAVFGGSQDVFNCFLGNRKIDLNAPTPDLGLTTLHLALINNKVSIAQQLIVSRHVDINQPNTYNQLPVTFAVLSGNKVLLQALLDRGTKLDLKDTCGRTPLAFALLIGDEEATKSVAQAMKSKAIIDDFALYRALARLNNNPNIEHVLLNMEKSVKVGRKRERHSIESILTHQANVRRVRRAVIGALQTIQASAIPNPDRVLAGPPPADSDMQHAPSSHLATYVESGSSSEMEVEPVELVQVDRGLLNRILNGVENTNYRLSCVETTQGNDRQNNQQEFKQLRQELEQEIERREELEGEVNTVKNDLTTLTEQVSKLRENDRKQDIEIASLKDLIAKMNGDLKRNFMMAPENYSQNQLDYFRSLHLVLSQRFLVASGIDSRQLTVSSAAVGRIDRTSIAASLAGNVAGLAKVSSDVSQGLAIAGSVTGLLKTLGDNWVQTYAQNHSQSIFHFFTSVQKLSPYSYELAVSLIPDIDNEIQIASDKQELEDSRQISTVEQGLSSLKRLAARFSCLSVSKKEVTKNHEIFKIADSHVNKLTLGIYALSQKNSEEFKDLANKIFLGSYDDAISWAKAVIEQT